ncbi:hypothetical protein ACIQWA_35455 [Kitasatospora sp. NPDC098652]|uniref:hypothetical protein n=1 Tax=Kitasatospora sp. NPDC098652 TaxID=3364095 RepID=UPI00380AF56F
MFTRWPGSGELRRIPRSTSAAAARCAARSKRIVLVDPARTLTAKEANGFRGRTLALDQQRELFLRWTTDEHLYPHEALLGMLALLHGASSSEVPMLQIDHVDPVARTFRLGERPHPVPLDPASWRCCTAVSLTVRRGRRPTLTCWSPKGRRPGEARPQLPTYPTSLTSADTRPG